MAQDEKPEKSRKRGRRENKAGSEGRPDHTASLCESGEGARSRHRLGQGLGLDKHSGLDFILHLPLGQVPLCCEQPGNHRKKT